MANLNFLWPPIDDIEDAKKAAHIGAGCAFLVAIITAIFTSLSLRGMKLFPGLNASSFVDVGLFLMIGFFIYRYSRIAAVAGLLLYAGEQILMMKTMGFRFSLIPLFFTCHFISGVRGTFDYHHMKKSELQEPTQIPPPQIFQQTPEVSKKRPGLLWAAVLVLLAAFGTGTWYFLSYQKNKATPSSLTAVTNPQEAASDTGAASSSDAFPQTVLPAPGETTFKMKDGKTITGRVLLEDDVYYSVETSGGRQEIVIKEDIA